MKLVISNKPYSPWPFRAWLLMRELGIPFEEELVDLSMPGKAERLQARSPSGRLPVLIDGNTIVWDSMSIIEYLHERLPGAGVWPEAPAARAHARSVAAEMHAGFPALRRSLIMNMRRKPRPVHLEAPALADIARVTDIWTSTREEFGEGKPFLYGTFCAADAVFAPIVNRFHGYAVQVPPNCRAYMETIQSLEGYKTWLADSLADPWHNEKTDNL